MFQRFGLPDLFAGLWRRRIRIAALFLAAGLAGGLYAALSTWSADAQTTETPAHYREFLTLQINAIPDANTMDPFEQSRKVRGAYLNAFRSEVFASYLFGEFPEFPWQELLMPNPAIQDSFDYIPNADIRRIMSAFSFNPPNETSTLEITFFCTDDHAGGQIMDAFIRYYEDIRATISPATIMEQGRTSLYLPAATVTETVSTGAFLKNVLRRALIWSIGAEALYLTAVFFLLLLRPVLNRRGDFALYGDFPVWEITAPAPPSGSPRGDDLLYIAKRLSAQPPDCRTLLFSCPGADDAARKNRILAGLAARMEQAGLPVRVLNGDPAFVPSAEIAGAVLDVTAQTDAFSLHLDRILPQAASLPPETVVLINLPPLSAAAPLLDGDGAVPHALLTVSYTRTGYAAFTAAQRALAENGVALLAVAAYKNQDVLGRDPS